MTCPKCGKKGLATLIKCEKCGQVMCTTCKHGSAKCPVCRGNLVTIK